MARLVAALVMAVFALGATTTAFACGGTNNKTGTQASSATVVQTGSTKTTTTVKPEGGTGG